MSRNIDWEKPLSDKDREWASQFSIHADRIAANDAEFASVDNGSLGGEADEVPPYSEWSKKDLTAEVKKRPSTTLPTGTYNAADLAAILDADDDVAEAAEAAAAASKTAA